MLPRVIGVSAEEMTPPLSRKDGVFTWAPWKPGLARIPADNVSIEAPPRRGVLWGVPRPPLPGPPVPALGLSPHLSPRL